MANINTWIAMGRPTLKSWNQATQSYGLKLPRSPDNTDWECDVVAERQAPLSALEQWYELKPLCKGSYRATAGLAYSATAQGFVATPKTIAAPDAVMLKPAPEPIVVTPQTVTPTTATPGRAIDPTMKSAPTPALGISPQGATPMVSTSSAGSLSNLANLLPVPGASIISAGLDLLGLTGKSKCPGPYNYDPLTGGCVPKPGTTSFTVPSQQCPTGTTYDAATGQCKVGGITGAVQRTLPGGATGYVEPTGWQSTQGFGLQGVVPQSYSTTRLACPAGYVLYGNKGGRNPGMEICLPRGFLPNKHRKWPKAPRPAMTAQDVKTLNRINAIQRKVSNMAVKAGYRKPRKR